MLVLNRLYLLTYQSLTSNEVHLTVRRPNAEATLSITKLIVC